METPQPAQPQTQVAIKLPIPATDYSTLYQIPKFEVLHSKLREMIVRSPFLVGTPQHYTRLAEDISTYLFNKYIGNRMKDMTTDDWAVEWFAEDLKWKLAESRAKGRNGWDRPDLCPEEFLAELFANHAFKGNKDNFLDLAALAMMLHERNVNPKVLQQAMFKKAAGFVTTGVAHRESQKA